MDVDKGIEKSIRRIVSDVPLIRERTLARTRHTLRGIHFTSGCGTHAHVTVGSFLSHDKFHTNVMMK